MQVWSNDRYQSPLHRVVVTANHERYSAPFFFNPSYDALCAPLPELVQVDGRPRYRPIRWGEFRSLRAAGDYADIGEEVQVEHYRVVSHLAPLGRETSVLREQGDPLSTTGSDRRRRQ